MPRKKKTNVLPELKKGLNLTTLLKKTVPLMYLINMEYQPDADPYSVAISFSQPIVRIVLPRSLLKEMGDA